MGGVRLDYAHLNDSGCKGMLTPCHCLDMLFSFPLDVALLPFTIPYTLLKDTSPAAPPPSQEEPPKE